MEKPKVVEKVMGMNNKINKRKRKEDKWADEYHSGMNFVCVEKSSECVSYLELVVCVNILPHCIHQSRPCCSLSPSAHTHCPSPACQSPHRSRSPPPISASPNEQQPIPRESPLSPRPLAPRPAAGIPQSNARQEWSLAAAASTRRAGRRRVFAGCQSQEREGLMG